MRRERQGGLVRVLLLVRRGGDIDNYEKCERGDCMNESTAMAENKKKKKGERNMNLDES